jgi:hypothetical protein
VDDLADDASIFDTLLASGVCRQVRSDLCKLLLRQPKFGHRLLLHLGGISGTPAKPNLWIPSPDIVADHLIAVRALTVEYGRDVDAAIDPALHALGKALRREKSGTGSLDINH